MAGATKSRRSKLPKNEPEGAIVVVHDAATSPAPGVAHRENESRRRHKYFPKIGDLHTEEKENLMRRYEADSKYAVASSNVTLSTLEEEKLVLEVCRTMLFRERLKPGVPVSRADLLKTMDWRKGAASVVLKLAQTKLLFATGLEMCELSAATGAKDAGNGYFVLRSWMPVALRQRFLVDKQQIPEQQLALEGLTTVVLALIRMDGEITSETTLWRLLEDVGIRKKEEEGHPKFGITVEEALKGMIARKYLKVSREGGAENDLKYEWGTAANTQAITKHVQDFIHQTCGEGN